MNFQSVATLFSRIESVSSRTEITQVLAELFRQASAEEAHFLAYFCMGKLYPAYHDIKINLAEKSLVRALAALLGQEVASVAFEVKECGDIGLYAEEALCLRECVPQASELTVCAVRDALHEMAGTSGVGSQEKKEQLVITLLQQLQPLGARYVVRSIVGKLRLGFSDMTLLDAYSWMMRGDKTLRPTLERFYNVCADIGRVIVLLKEEGVDALETFGVVPGIPVRPAAAERLVDAAAIIKKIGSCVVQPKLDGFRVQVHAFEEGGKKKVCFFSRNLNDMSEMFPELVKAIKRLPVSSVVMEGEAIAKHSETGIFLPFQETMKRRRKYCIKEAAETVPLTLYIFDLLYVDGQSCLGLGHAKRRTQLQTLLKHASSESGVVLIEEQEVCTADELSDAFDAAMDGGLEGVIAKKVDAPYKAGKRNFNWIKLKRQESGQLNDTIDCLILGYYRGTGRRAAFGIGALLVGVYNPKRDVFETIAKIGTGLSDEQWRAIKKQCDANLITSQPSNIDCPMALVPDVWTSPAIVCMIRADDITRSPLHTTGKEGDAQGYALRFPRIMGQRPDKNPEDTTSPDEIKQLYKLQDLKVR